MRFSRTIWLLSLVSLFNDVASEMLYPVIPLYLAQTGLTMAHIGFLEGLAEVTAGISKGYFGNLSDHLGKRVVFIRAGYLLSTLSKPLLVLFQSIAWIFTARTADRLGKGLRTAARDALLAAEAGNANKGRVFGFHRAMDTLGAIAGPLIALLLLRFEVTSLRNIFFIAFLPGLVSLLLLFLVKEKPFPRSKEKRPGFFSFFSYWKQAPPAYRKLLAGIVLFFLFNSSDFFLLIRSRELLGNDREALYLTIQAYILYNIVYAAAAYPAGVLADRLGVKPVFVLGLLLFAGVYGGMAFAETPAFIYLVFAVYGIYAAATEGILKAWISRLAPVEQRGTALGLAATCQNLSAMLASFMAGLIWSGAGASFLFGLTAVFTLGVCMYFVVAVPAKA